MSETTLIHFRSEDIRRVVGNAALFAGVDRALPALVAVHLDYDGETLTACGTDRYVLGSDTAKRIDDTNVGEPFSFLLNAVDAKRLLAALPAKNHAFACVELSIDEGRLKLTTDESTVTIFAPVDSQFPAWRSIVPSGDLGDATSIPSIAWNPKNIALFAKVTVEGKKASKMRLTFRGASKCVRVDIGETFVGAIMPIREIA